MKLKKKKNKELCLELSISLKVIALYLIDKMNEGETIRKS